MTYNTSVYNRENLHERDRAELDYWRDVFYNCVENEVFTARLEGARGALGQIQQEIINDFVENLKKGIGYQLMENLVAIIDNYDEEELPERETYTTYHYDREDEPNDNR